MMRRRRTPRAQDYDWLNLHCPKCHSIKVIKMLHCSDCRYHLTYCEEDTEACGNCKNWVTRNSIRQRFQCQECGHQFSEVRRVL